MHERGSGAHQIVNDRCKISKSIKHCGEHHMEVKLVIDCSLKSSFEFWGPARTMQTSGSTNWKHEME